MAAAGAAEVSVDFDQVQPRFGTWHKGPARVTAKLSSQGRQRQGLRVEFTASKTGGPRPRSLEAGVWINLPATNLSRASYVSFALKGQIEGVEVGLRDGFWFEQYLPVAEFVTSAEGPWQQVVIPADRFGQLANWHDLRTFSLRRRQLSSDQELVLDNITIKLGREARPAPPKVRAPRPAPSELDELRFLDLVERTGCMYFWYEANPTNGLVKDRCLAFYRDAFPVASIAAVGFGLPSLCVAEARGWLPRAQVYERVRRTLDFFLNQAEQVHGFFYHFLEMDTGQRAWNCELSSIDTTLLLAGILFAGEYFSGTEIQEMADQIYRRVDWRWMLNGGIHPSMGWRPEQGFLDARWSGFNEGLLLLVLAVGSPTHPISPEAWWQVDRRLHAYGPYRFAGPGILFLHQYPHIFIDFRFIEDGLLDYYRNSVEVTLAARRWAIDHSSRSRSYGPECWGLTACDGPSGYRAYGAPFGEEDGTVAPTAAGGSIVFTPEESLAALRYFYRLDGGALWGKWGFVDSFNQQLGWISDIHIGIDQGPIALMIENYRSGLIWHYFMRNPHVQRGLRRCGFRPRTITLSEIDLSGTWEIRRGDDLDRGTWQQIKVPGPWEEVGLAAFTNYDGYGLYRCTFSLPELPAVWLTNEVVLEIGGIDDVDQTWVNGVLVGQSGRFPPEFATAWSRPRQYRVPADALRQGKNIILLRVYDQVGQGGLWRGPVRLRAVRRYPACWRGQQEDDNESQSRSDVVSARQSGGGSG